ncbi:hypothetical protein [Rhizobium rhizogenes]|uniref:hypothetical protein n=1 Tax=Rhizobium rhizogenes TaxID=359 RepID=UPI00157349BE|nr:hypothetical protein [Rhizobium rhizogenes]NTI78674.1 hypothetical protein [Rhizobium rhizogenes]
MDRTFHLECLDAEKAAHISILAIIDFWQNTKLLPKNCNRKVALAERKIYDFIDARLYVGKNLKSMRYLK